MNEGFDRNSILAELENIKRSVTRIENTVGIKEEGIDRRLELLKIIYDAGGALLREEFHKEGNKLGYNTRGLGGFFVGKKPLLTYVKIKGKDYAALTEEGRKVLRAHGLIE